MNRTAPAFYTHLQRQNHLHVVEEHQRAKRVERGVVQHTRQHHVLQVPDAVRLVDLGAHARIRDGHHLCVRSDSSIRGQLSL